MTTTKTAVDDSRRYRKHRVRMLRLAMLPVAMIPLMLAAVGLLFLPATYWTAVLEERHLAGLFGENYRDYCRRVPRLLPAVGRYVRLERLEISTRSLAKWTIETAGIMMVPIAEDMIQIGHAHHWLPTLWTLRF